MYYQKTCEQCGKQFSAQKSSTRFCSKYCADAAYKVKLRNMNNSLLLKSLDSEKKRGHCDMRDIMSPRLLAEYIGVSLPTIYRYLAEGHFPSLRIRGRTIIRKLDVDKLFDQAPPYRKREALHISEGEKPKTASKTVTTEIQYISAKEVAERYNLSPSGAYKVLQESGITVVSHRNKQFYPLSEVEALFRKRESSSHPEIKEWYTVADIQEKYGLMPTSVYDIATNYQIPRKKIHRVTYYSKIHFDMARGARCPEESLWYTVQEAMDKYGQTRDQVYGVLRYNNVERVQVGRNVKFRKNDYDELMKFVAVQRKEE